MRQLSLFLIKRSGNAPEKDWSSKVEFSRNVYEGDSDEEITLYGQSDHQHSETGIGRNASS